MRPLLFCALAAPLLLAAKPFVYTLPDEPEVSLAAGAGADLVSANCAACHSLDYLSTQPPGKGAQFWRDSVTKMVKIYGAPIAPADADAIADYLGHSYGKSAS
jgi:mono/diheme cytochrome c family protein